MKKSLLLVLVLLLLFTFAGCSNSNDGSSNNDGGQSTDASNTENTYDKVYEFKISNVVFPEDPLNVAQQYFVDTICERSGGRIKGTIFNSRSISQSDRENAEKTQQNIVQMSTSPTFTMAGLGDIKGFYLADYPYLLTNDEETYKIFDGEIGKKLGEQLLEKTGLRYYGVYNLGWVKMATKGNKPLVDLDSFKNMKIRTSASDLYIEFLNRLGINPTPMNYGEIFTGLQQGVVDGMMTSTALFVSDRFYEVLDQMSDMDPYPICHVVYCNDSFYQSLPDDLKVVWDECMADYLNYTRELHAEAEIEAFEELARQGMNCIRLTPEQKQVFIDVGLSVTNDKPEIVGEDLFNRAKTELNK